MERFFQKTEFLRASDEKNGQKTHEMAGTAASYGVISKGDYRRVMFSPGCMAAALAKADLECYSLFNHDPNWVLGCTTNGSLELSDEPTGLRQKTYLKEGDNEQIDTMISHLLASRITRMSFGVDFTLDGIKWDVIDGDDVMVVQPNGVGNIYDVSPVTYGAFKESRLDSSAQRAANEALTTAFKIKYDGPIARTELESMRHFARSLNLLIAESEKESDTPTRSGLTAIELKAKYPHLFA